MSLDFIAVIVVVAVAWGAMTVKVESLERKSEQDKIEAKQEQAEVKLETKGLANEVNMLNRKMDVIGANQDNFRAQIIQIGQSLEKIEEAVQK